MADTPDGSGSESFASIDAAMDSWQTEEEQDRETDTQAQTEAATETETPDAPEGEDGEIDLADQEEDPDAEIETVDEQDHSDFAPDTARIRLEDGTFSTVGELRRSFFREADYTRSKQALAEEKRAQESFVAGVKSRESEVNLQTQVLMALADKVAPKRPDPNLIGTELTVEDFIQQKAAADEFERGLQQLSAYLAEGQKKQAKEAEDAAKADWDNHKTQLVQRDKRFADKKWRDTVFYAQAARHADYYGYTSEEFGKMRDHRHFMMARDAFAYRDLIAKNKQKPAQQAQPPRPVLTGSKRPPNAQHQARQEAKARFNKNPTIHNALDLID